MKWLFFPFGLIAMKMMHIKNYDVVIISGTYCAKYVRIDKESKVIIYTYTPFRLAWNPSSYKEYNDSKGIARLLFNIVIKILRNIDKREAQKANLFLAMTDETAERIRKAYGVTNIKIIHPPVKAYNFTLNETSEKKYYLLVSRFEFYKRVDLAIDAFNSLNLPLIIVGNGSKKEELMKQANSNIIFKSGLSAEELKELYANAKAFIFPQYEDYGITPLESNASGRPVIAYAKGGVLETMIPYNESNQEFTSIFFHEQTSESLIQAINKLEQLAIPSDFIKSHALKFDESVFIKQLLEIVES
jgi:glycosyltransferase involved in cell wall biosynthesis